MRRARVVAGAVAVVIASCGGTAPSTTTVAPTASTGITTSSSTSTTTSTSMPAPPMPLRGFSISPQDSTAEAFAGFLDLLEESSTLLEWVGDGFEWAEGGTPDVTVQLAAQAGVEPITIGGWTRTEDGSLVRPLDDATIAVYVDAAAGFAARHTPQYMGFGVEIDTHWREFPERWEESTALFASVADAIHEASPGTSVIVVFQLERLRGLQGGLFGGENSPDLAAWDLLDDFPAADVIGFTTYPGLVFESPDAMPGDYYAEIADHTDKPIAFTEMGWQAGGDFGDWSGSEGNQSRFVARFPDLIDGLDVAFFTWSFMFDQPFPGTFGTMGMFTADGRARPAWDVWLGG